MGVLRTTTAALLMSVTAANAEPPSLLGLQIGQPAPPSCSSAGRAAPCAISSRRNEVAEVFDVALPAGGLPDFVKYGKIFADVIDGRVEQISIFTTGPRSQAEVLGQLRDKFGTPKELSDETAQNRFGAQFHYADAAWSIDGTVVHFRGLFDDINTGLITLSSELYTAKIAESLRAKAANGPHL